MKKYLLILPALVLGLFAQSAFASNSVTPSSSSVKAVVPVSAIPVIGVTFLVGGAGLLLGLAKFVFHLF